MVHETKVILTQGKLLNLPFSQSIGIFVKNDIFKILKIELKLGLEPKNIHPICALSGKEARIGYL
jgi:hypothetical protein